jgi:hypothetical protein
MAYEALRRETVPGGTMRPFFIKLGLFFAIHAATIGGALALASL